MGVPTSEVEVHQPNCLFHICGIVGRNHTNVVTANVLSAQHSSKSASYCYTFVAVLRKHVHIQTYMDKVQMSSEEGRIHGSISIMLDGGGPQISL